MICQKSGPLYYGLERLMLLMLATTLTMRRTVEHIILNDSYSNLPLMDSKGYELKVRYPTPHVFVQFEDPYQQFKEIYFGALPLLPRFRSNKDFVPQTIREYAWTKFQEFRSGHETIASSGITSLAKGCL